MITYIYKIDFPFNFRINVFRHLIKENKTFLFPISPWTTTSQVNVSPSSPIKERINVPPSTPKKEGLKVRGNGVGGLLIGTEIPRRKALYSEDFTRLTVRTS